MTGADRIVVHIDVLRLASADPDALDPWLRSCAADVFERVRAQPVAWAVEQAIADAFAAPIGDAR